MFLAHKKGIKLDGNNPTLLYGYGGFNIPMVPGFGQSGSPARCMVLWALAWSALAAFGLDALRDLTSPRALVVRAEGTRRIPAREVVPEDIVVLNEGDRVPADGLVLDSVNFSCDESLLTGESVPVRKRVATRAEAAPGEGGGGDRSRQSRLLVRGGAE
jgi:P-type E1-E2 ATPase